MRKQYFWHRFFSHQPDLNFDNPLVAEEMLDVARFWLRLGIDGFRADAVPYLFERDGVREGEGRGGEERGMGVSGMGWLLVDGWVV